MFDQLWMSLLLRGCNFTKWVCNSRAELERSFKGSSSHRSQQWNSYTWKRALNARVIVETDEFGVLPRTDFVLPWTDCVLPWVDFVLLRVDFALQWNCFAYCQFFFYSIDNCPHVVINNKASNCRTEIFPARLVSILKMCLLFPVSFFWLMLK